MVLNKMQKFLYSKRKHKENKKQLTHWEKIFANDVTNKELVSKIYNQFTKLNITKTNNSIFKKWSEDLDISSKKTYRWPKST